MTKNNEKLLRAPEEDYSLKIKGLEAKITSWRSTPATTLITVLVILNIAIGLAAYYFFKPIFLISLLFDYKIVDALLYAFKQEPWKLCNEKTLVDYLLKMARMGEKNKPLLPTEEGKLYSPQIKTISAKANMKET